MKLAKTAKFPHSVQLFRFCQRVLSQKREHKVHDQEVGAILGFNPSDCSHWKRGKKNVRSVFALEKLAKTLEVEISLIYDIVSGTIDIDEALYEYNQAQEFQAGIQQLAGDDQALLMVRKRCEAFVHKLHRQSEFIVPPLYLPEILRFFSFITAQSADMVDRLSRILRVRPGQYCIQFKKGDLKAQTRMSIVNELGRILLQGERGQFPELGEIDESLIKFEQHLFMVELLAPKAMVKREIRELDSRRNMVAELATLFWVPKSLIGLQLQDILRTKSVEPENSVEPRQERGPERAHL